MATELVCPLCGATLKKMDGAEAVGSGRQFVPFKCTDQHIWMVSEDAGSFVLTHAK
jgi:hypothetical protein